MSAKSKKIIKGIAWSVTLIGITTLIVLGVTKEEISAGTVLIDIAVVAVAEVVKFVIGKIQ